MSLRSKKRNRKSACGNRHLCGAPARSHRRLAVEPLESRRLLAVSPVLVKDFAAEGQAAPYALTDVDGTLFFAAGDTTTGVELWKSDGTSACTELVKDIAAGPGSSKPQELTAVHGTLFFVANDSGDEDVEGGSGGGGGGGGHDDGGNHAMGIVVTNEPGHDDGDQHDDHDAGDQDDDHDAGGHDDDGSEGCNRGCKRLT